MRPRCSRCSICANSAAFAPKSVPLQSGNVVQASPAKLELTYAPRHIATNPRNAARPSASACGVAVKRVPAGGSRWARSASAASTARSSIAAAQCNMTESGLFERWTVAAPRPTCTRKTRPSAASIGRTPAIRRRTLQPAANRPSSNEAFDESDEAVRPLEQDAALHRRDERSVAQRPIGAGHPRSVDPNPTAEDGERERERHGRGRERSEQFHHRPTFVGENGNSACLEVVFGLLKKRIRCSDDFS